MEDYCQNENECEKLHDASSKGNVMMNIGFPCFLLGFICPMKLFRVDKCFHDTHNDVIKKSEEAKIKGTENQSPRKFHMSFIFLGLFGLK